MKIIKIFFNSYNYPKIYHNYKHNKNLFNNRNYKEENKNPDNKEYFKMSN